MTFSSLVSDIAGKIVTRISAGTMTAGHHLVAQALADELNVSRSPVRDALVLLSDEGVLEQQPRRGYFVSDDAIRIVQSPQLQKLTARNQMDAYYQIADDWLHDRIGAENTEMQLRHKYELSAAALDDILVRAVQDGWAMQKPGYGWVFLDVAKSPDAFEQIYRLRQAIEPAALLEPTFSVDAQVLAALKKEQQMILDADMKDLTTEAVLQSGYRFHESLTAMSNNPFFVRALKQANNMRRLREYNINIVSARVKKQCEEHLAILGMIERGEIVDASYALRQHLGGALMQKTQQ